MTSKFDANVRELQGLKELLAFIAYAGPPLVVNEYEYVLPRGINNCEGRCASATFADGSKLYIVTDYDAGYSEHTSGDGATVSYWVLDERTVTP